MSHPQKVGLLSWGWPKALVDSERALKQLRLDGVVYIAQTANLKPGDIVSRRVVDADDYDLWAA